MYQASAYPRHSEAQKILFCKRTHTLLSSPRFLHSQCPICPEFLPPGVAKTVPHTPHRYTHRERKFTNRTPPKHNSSTNIARAETMTSTANRYSLIVGFSASRFC
ncbi:hypothetical protein BU24DRAFT_420155 [Aaosphaeria arxii CBS 175.79]|uniref:Uncharacterized protein n=1 Tax=Aaosphaeria arxii CBS 175.79 TaxID=1450172 RepID=A0A6A5XWQ3_9PLEO|nr:uncharacterized protein BU24DRAFT_420155 [Aaosphaeria arxii CBS 175.79]KAF2017131.1 hypothetical protein BU24DRAFT_420155 [Aaosphaeria arxii CBS 175.79]